MFGGVRMFVNTYVISMFMRIVKNVINTSRELEWSWTEQCHDFYKVVIPFLLQNITFNHSVAVPIMYDAFRYTDFILKLKCTLKLYSKWHVRYRTVRFLFFLRKESTKNKHCGFFYRVCTKKYACTLSAFFKLSVLVSICVCLSVC